MFVRRQGQESFPPCVVVFVVDELIVVGVSQHVLFVVFVVAVGQHTVFHLAPETLKLTPAILNLPFG